MIVWVISLHLWSSPAGPGIDRWIGRDYTSEAECLRERSTMEARYGTLECKPLRAAGS